MPFHYLLKTAPSQPHRSHKIPHITNYDSCPKYYFALTLCLNMKQVKTFQEHICWLSSKPEDRSYYLLLFPDSCTHISKLPTNPTHIIENNSWQTHYFALKLCSNMNHISRPFQCIFDFLCLISGAEVMIYFSSFHTFHWASKCNNFSARPQS